MIKVQESSISFSGILPNILSEYGLLTNRLLNSKEIPDELIYETIRLAFELENKNLMDLITTDLEMTEQLKAQIENYKKEFEKGE